MLYYGVYNIQTGNMGQFFVSMFFITFEFQDWYLILICRMMICLTWKSGFCTTNAQLVEFYRSAKIYSLKRKWQFYFYELQILVFPKNMVSSSHCDITFAYIWWLNKFLFNFLLHMLRFKTQFIFYIWWKHMSWPHLKQKQITLSVMSCVRMFMTLETKHTHL